MGTTTNQTVMRLSPEAFAKAMANRVTRERARIAAEIEAKADELEGMPPSMSASVALRELAASIRSPRSLTLVQSGTPPALSAIGTEDRDEDPDYEHEPELPAVQLNSDEADADALLRARSSFHRPITQLRD